MSRITKYFLKYFFSLALISGAVVFLLYLNERAAEKKILYAGEKNLVRLEKEELDKEFTDVISDLRFISSGHEVKKFLKARGKGLDIIGDLSMYCLSKPYCDRVRI
ncbi:MAG: hypothetical protein ACE5DR_04160, partial [Thermodesulfobacteriota bacterium]